MNNIGAVVVGIAVIAVFVWAAYLLNTGRVRPTRTEEAPPNLRPYLTDDELESRRLNRVLMYALVGAFVLAVVMPIYFLGEPDRQAEAAEGFLERDIHLGEEWFIEFQCVNCHGVGGSGGGVTWIDERSGVETTWAVPSLNDVLYRYSPEEVRFWITYGRAGTPMPPAGLEGGGAMTSQQIDQTIAYITSFQISQEEALAKVNPAVTQALDRLEVAEERVDEFIATQLEERAIIEAASELVAAVGGVPEQIAAVLSDPETCTSDAAELVLKSCAGPAQDTDRDGIGDAAEAEAAALLAQAAAALGDDALGIDLDPLNAFSNVDEAGTAIADLTALDTALTALDTAVLNLNVTVANQELFLANNQRGLDFLMEAGQEQRWEIDIARIADEAFGGDVEAATRAAGLYNGLCARCHTGGYSEGVPFTEPVGAGGFGPALEGGRSSVQFPDPEDHYEFLLEGSELAGPYGVYGVGRGWMPGFGFVVSEADLRLIVQFERAL